jgi:hypothetical protein
MSRKIDKLHPSYIEVYHKFLYSVSMFSKQQLEKLYVKKGLSMQSIATQFGCSLHKVQYWMGKHAIPSRSIGEAIYQKHNPKGDPFLFSRPITVDEHKLFGIGLGLYWGEGTKSNTTSVRLGNSDPALLCTFMEFLSRFYGVKKSDYRFGLQIFSDIAPEKALDFWRKSLKVREQQFHPTIVVTRSGSLGTYRKKSQYGVVTVLYHNKKLRDLLNTHLAAIAQW